ncbi:MAG: DSD1 family PLP-dependent enzyme [Saprospiraceae bacterium]|nr:DSD1 family PLP-dependent enzyme [Saprospiraceae bacterium]
MKKSMKSRRHFMQTAGTAAITIPTLIKGYSSTEMQIFDRNNLSEVDISKWDLDTPALCLDLDAFEKNLQVMHHAMVENGIASRPHAKTHKCPAIARMQLESGSIGICVAKVSEAQIMFEHGISQILCTTTNVSKQKIKHAMNLRRWCSTFIQATDSADNARMLSEAAESMNITADIVVDVDPGGHRTGITPGDPALELAQIVDRLPGLNLQGILCYDGGSQHVKGFEIRREQTLERLAAAGETLSLMQRSGLNTGIFSGGGTGTYNIDHETAGFTDVQAGSYVFMDAQYLAIGAKDNPDQYSDFQSCLTILSTVVNDQYPDRVTTDAGAKSCTINQPWPMVKGETGMNYRSGSDEFGTLTYEDPSRTYKVGDKLELIVSHCDPVVNLYNQIYAIRNDRVEAIWQIAARGMSR